MPRFSDEWVMDRVLFDYVSGGSCACCGISHAMFLPNGTNDLITSMTDLETDQMNNEIDILNHQNHPWPKPLRDQIWCDRVKLKQKLKSSISKYTTFWDQHGTAFTEWLMFIPSSSSSSSTSAATTTSIHHTTTINKMENRTDTNDTKKIDPPSKVQLLQRCLQMSRDELISYIQQEYNLHSAYMVVLTAVIEQVAHFPETKYPMDSIRCRNSTSTTTGSSSLMNDKNPNLSTNDYLAELHFEQILQFGRMTGFTLPIIEQKLKEAKDNDTDSGHFIQIIRQDVLQVLLDRIRTLGNAKLLGRGPSTTTSMKKAIIGSTNKRSNHKNIEDDDDDQEDDDIDEADDDDDDYDVDGPTRIGSLVEDSLVDNISSSSPSSKCAIPTPSFQSDRRMIRLILARYWADVLIKRYYADTNVIVDS